jgi:hypothetical protein
VAGGCGAGVGVVLGTSGLELTGAGGAPGGVAVGKGKGVGVTTGGETGGVTFEGD